VSFLDETRHEESIHAAALLEVIALDADDARNAAAGGADRLELVSGMDVGGLTPSLETFRAVRAAVDVPIRVMIRLQGGFSFGDARACDALCASADVLRDAGADAFVLGWLDGRGRVDVAALRAVLARLDGCAWTFHRAMDACADRDAAYAAIRGLPGIDTVLTSGGAALDVNVLTAEAKRERGALRVLAGGGVREEHVAPLRAGGVTAFHVGSAVRADGSWGASVSTERVRRFRALLARVSTVP